MALAQAAGPPRQSGVEAILEVCSLRLLGKARTNDRYHRFLADQASVRLGSFGFCFYCIQMCICLVFAALLSIARERVALR
jgi:hypothetical protein